MATTVLHTPITAAIAKAAITAGMATIIIPETAITFTIGGAAAIAGTMDNAAIGKPAVIAEMTVRTGADITSGATTVRNGVMTAATGVNIGAMIAGNGVTTGAMIAVTGGMNAQGARVN